MIRSLLLFFFIGVVYYALKTLVRSAVRGYHQEDRKRSALMGEEMVLDPQCRTYVPKRRAVGRRIDGTLLYFCSETCAKAYEQQHKT
jgi:YHS domain-containing protein